MPRRVLLSSRAERWLHREIAYLAERNTSAARRVLDRLTEARRQLAAFPRSGRPGIVPGTRRLVIGPYILTYREQAGNLEIIDIRHDRQSAEEDAP